MADLVISRGSLLGGGRWAVGEVIGEGACGKVYSVTCAKPITESGLASAASIDAVALSAGASTLWVAKVIALGKGKSKKQKEQERLCNTLNYEYMLHTGVLLDFPFRPAHPLKFYGDDASAGVRFMIMERLETDLVGYAMRGPLPTASKIAELGLQILEGLEWLHQRYYIFVDVKPENFMMKGDRLYFVDYGLMERWVGHTGGSRAKEQLNNQPIAGTPTFCSLAVHSGSNPSRKDDVEAMGYVLLSLRSEGKLPWSSAPSEDTCRDMKRDCDLEALAMEHDLEEVGTIIRLCRSWSYGDVPDYSTVRAILQQMRTRKSSSGGGGARAAASRSSDHKKTTPSSSSSSTAPATTAAALKQNSIKASHISSSSSISNNSSGSQQSSRKRPASATTAAATAAATTAAATTAATTESGMGVGVGVSVGKKSSAKPAASAKRGVIDLTKENAVNYNGVSCGSAKDREMNTKLPQPPPRQEQQQMASSYSARAPALSLRFSAGPLGPFSTLSGGGNVVNSLLFPLAPASESENHHNRKGSSVGSACVASTTTTTTNTGTAATETVGVIGKGADCEIILARDEYISDRHLQYKVAGDALYFKDMGSTNGTKLNGELLPKRRWVAAAVGDALQIGQTQGVVTIA